MKKSETEEPSPFDYETEWTTCWDCGGSGYTHHNCGEDSCCCLYPEDNVTCDTCNGEGGWES